MKKNPYYTIQSVADTIQLLPFGQAIADFNPTVELPDADAWRAFSFSAEETAILEESGVVDSGISAKISSLRQQEHALPSLAIAGLTVQCYGAQAHLPREFAAFRQTTGTSSCDTALILTTAHPGNTINGTILLRNRELFVIDANEIYILLFPQFPCIREVWLRKNDATSIVFLEPAAVAHFGLPAVREAVFHAYRPCFLYLAAQHGMYAIHSVSIGYPKAPAARNAQSAPHSAAPPVDSGFDSLADGYAWLFSAPSGTGKTTHATLWQQHYGVNILNGDLNLIAIQDNVPVAHGIPWCGTSGIATRASYAVRGITLLKRGSKDHIVPLSDAKQITAVLHRLISPLWSEAQLVAALQFCTAFIKKATVVSLACTKDASAAAVMKAYIDALPAL